MCTYSSKDTDLNMWHLDTIFWNVPWRYEGSAPEDISLPDVRYRKRCISSEAIRNMQNYLWRSSLRNFFLLSVDFGRHFQWQERWWRPHTEGPWSGPPTNCSRTKSMLLVRLPCYMPFLSVIYYKHTLALPYTFLLFVNSTVLEIMPARSSCLQIFWSC